MRVFQWILCPAIISCGEMQLSLPSHKHTHLHTCTQREIVADMFTSPDRHLPLSLRGCKVFSLQPSLLRNKHACSHVCTRAPYRTSQMLNRFQRGEPTRLDKPLWKLWTRREESTLSTAHVHPTIPSITAPQIWACSLSEIGPFPSVFNYMWERVGNYHAAFRKTDKC